MAIPSFGKPFVTFLIGGLGSGKTELALNLAAHHSEKLGPGKVDLLDLDIVNPLFRVRKVSRDISSFGVNLVMPDSRVLNGDLPALPAAVWAALENPERVVVCDVGGGELGLRPLARLREFSRKRETFTFFVLNPFRPGFLKLSEIRENFRYMEGLSALKVTHLVANPHLVGETTVEIFSEGYRIIQEFAEEIGLPIAFAMATKEIAEKIPAQITSEIFVIRRFWKVPWFFGLEKEA
jgi:hypothetical protein